MTNQAKYILYSGIKFANDKWDIKSNVKYFFSDSRDGFKTYAFFDPVNLEIHVYVKNRAVMDLVRSVCHEIWHCVQLESGKLDKSGKVQDIGGDIEDEANAKAGEIVKEFSYKFSHESGIDVYAI